MHAIDTATAVNGEFVDADPLEGVAGTEADAAWLNDLQNNVLAVIAAANIAPTKGDSQDLANAIAELIAAAVGPAVQSAVNTAVADLPTGSGSGTAANQVAPYGMPTRAALATPDLNALNQSGFWSAPAGVANIPAGANPGVVFAIGNTAMSGADGAQIYIDLTSGSVWTRPRLAGAWGAWTLLSYTAPQSFSYGDTDNWGVWYQTTGEFVQGGFIEGPFPEQIVAVAFPYAFDACYGIKGWSYNPTANINIGNWIDEVSITNTSAQVLVNRVSNSSPNLPGFKWEARGKCAAMPVLSSTLNSGGSSGSSGSSGGTGGLSGNGNQQ
jgi:hypothetical protein